MGTPLKVLILEGCSADAESLAVELRRAGFEAVWERVESREGFAAALFPDLDLVLAGDTLAQFDAFDALDLMCARGSETPCIVMSGSAEENTAAEYCKRGAADCLSRESIARLGPVVASVIESTRENRRRIGAKSTLDMSEELHRAVVENANDGIAIRAEGKLVFANSAFLRILGMGGTLEVVGQPEEKFIHPDDRMMVRTRSKIGCSTDTTLYEYRVVRPDGEARVVQV